MQKAARNGDVSKLRELVAAGENIEGGGVTLQGLYDYLSPKVQDEAGRQNRDQTPTLSAGPDVLLR